MNSRQALPQAKRHSTQRLVVPARCYSYDELAELYNRTRVDYIVPMPMNGGRLAEYVQQYDIDMDASMISIGSNRLPHGIVMLGLREKRSWVTRLGLVPEQRGRKIGQHLMELSIEKSRQLHVHRIQLEVIKGNEPAYRLFRKLGFADAGELVILRRPPGTPSLESVPKETSIVALDPKAIPLCLAEREARIAWTEETPSLLKARDLRGYYAALGSGEEGWLIYQFSPFQLTHVVLSPAVSEEMALTLLYYLHKQHPMHDTKIENIPVGHPVLPAFQKLGYLEVFRRIEMYLHLSLD